MAYWEFLLQKEGDRDWLPLETAHVEISEGRYRIVAHTSYCEFPVEIRLSQSLATSPQKRRTLKRIGQTTENGLMVVIPFTHLTAGSWTIKCAAVNSEAANSGLDWQYGVHLQVLALESSLDYWDSDLEEAAFSDLSFTDNLPTAATPSSPPSPPPQLKSSSSLPPAAPSTIPDPAQLDAAVLEHLPLRLQLQHQAIVVQQQTSFTLQGQVTTFSEVTGLPPTSSLWVQLRDPETSQVLYQASKALTTASLPSRFDFLIVLPENVTTRLLVGEMSLWSATTPPQVLAIQGFTVTLNLDALLEKVANQGEKLAETVFENLATIASAPASSPPPREIPFQRIYAPSTGLTLPPIIYHPINSKATGSPTLPAFSEQLIRRRPSVPETRARPAKPISLPPIGNVPKPARSRKAPAPNNDPSVPVIDLPPLGRSQPAAPDTPASTDELPSMPEAATPEAATPEATTPEAVTPEAATIETETVSETPEKPFHPDLEGRFWSRLSALAHEAQKTAADLKAQMEAAGVTTNHNSPTLDLPDTQSPSSEPEATPFNHEVVIYDEVVEAVTTPETSAADAAPPLSTVMGPPLSEHLEVENISEIPIPQLKLPMGELTAGTPLPITVRLPLYPRRLAVKVWVTDIQSRSLVDRPRWLMTWTPTDAGEQTALLQLQVPFGTLEAQFDAIAIDLTTQRESHKTTLVRTIVPPNLPAPELGDPL